MKKIELNFEKKKFYLSEFKYLFFTLKIGLWSTIKNGIFYIKWSSWIMSKIEIRGEDSSRDGSGPSRVVEPIKEESHRICNAICNEKFSIGAMLNFWGRGFLNQKFCSFLSMMFCSCLFLETYRSCLISEDFDNALVYTCLFFTSQ